MNNVKIEFILQNNKKILNDLKNVNEAIISSINNDNDYYIDNEEKLENDLNKISELQNEIQKILSDNLWANIT